jgi:hypothetical protein
VQIFSNDHIGRSPSPRRGPHSSHPTDPRFFGLLTLGNSGGGFHSFCHKTKNLCFVTQTSETEFCRSEQRGSIIRWRPSASWVENFHRTVIWVRIRAGPFFFSAFSAPSAWPSSTHAADRRVLFSHFFRHDVAVPSRSRGRPPKLWVAPNSSFPKPVRPKLSSQQPHKQNTGA